MLGMSKGSTFFNDEYVLLLSILLISYVYFYLFFLVYAFMWANGSRFSSIESHSQ